MEVLEPPEEEDAKAEEAKYDTFLERDAGGIHV
jgi:hypothetical protein